MVEGPVEVELENGDIARSDRFKVAICTCRRSRTYPWCDTSHRRRSQPPPPSTGRANAAGEDDGGASGAVAGEDFGEGVAGVPGEGPDTDIPEREED
ncbi:CDGSH iron-sulfur domain-containing protein [Streptantibioticus silvisoli]|uniref:CDGSH iron-sulfur domain-containing protein n=1 Tax=Streptantibioticus silvisoli TaxID=2705255 RepID=A0ABT6W7B1_9ACTN|nr:CDGSH iron-sulfur domain-containing protein [Streptantibioticus silvisoli]MDI5965376.1 CDGSH iron-sulfur domain-containing protein [Streptantibioticus silvisoli]